MHLKFGIRTKKEKVDIALETQNDETFAFTAIFNIEPIIHGYTHIRLGCYRFGDSVFIQGKLCPSFFHHLVCKFK